MSSFVRVQDVNYLGAVNAFITYLEAVEMGPPQGGEATVTSGGVGFNQATVRLRTLPGRGFYYLVRIFGR